MRIFLTGATGFIGSRIVPELIAAGHQVLGLTRSEAGAEALRKAGADPFHGTLEDPGTLREGASMADAVIHCAFDHDFSNFVANTEKDRRNIEAMGDALAGSGRTLVITSGVGMGNGAPGEPALERNFDAGNHNPRKASEFAGQEVAKRGVNVVTVRLPQVHDTVKQGLITPLIEIYKQKGAVAYIGEGTNRFAAAHVLDVARLYRLAVEKAAEGAVYNAVAEEGVPVRAIAEVLAAGLKLPLVSSTQEDAPRHFGWMAMFAGLDIIASSKQTQADLDWHPTGPDLLTDLRNMQY